MNKLLTYPGVQPVYLGDFDFLQESITTALLQLLQGLTGQESPNCILSPASPEHDGAICYHGEILPLAYSTSNPNVSVYRVVSTYSSERTFKDGSTHKCYEQRRVETQPGSVSDPDHVTKFQLLSKLLVRDASKSSVRVGTHFGSQVQTTVSVGEIDGMITVAGNYFVPSDADVSVLAEAMPFNLPDGTWQFPVVIGSSIVVSTLTVSQGILRIAVPQTSVIGGTRGTFSLNIIR